MLKNFTNTLVGLRRALQVALCSDNFLDAITLALTNGLLGCLCKLLDRLLVVSEILLTPYKDNW